MFAGREALHSQGREIECSAREPKPKPVIAVGPRCDLSNAGLDFALGSGREPKVGSCVDADRSTAARLIPTAPAQSEGISASPPSGERDTNTHPPTSQRDFNRDLALAVRTALTGGAREDSPFNFSPDLDPLISHYTAKRGLDVQPAEGSGAQSKPEFVFPGESPAAAAGPRSNGSESELDGPVPFQSAPLTEHPAISSPTPVQSVYPLPKESLPWEGGAKSYSISTENSEPPRDFRSSGIPAGFYLNIENTIQAADHVIRLAQDAVHAAEPAHQHDEPAVGQHEPTLGLAARFRPAIALTLAIPLSAAIAWLIVVGPRPDKRTATPSPDAAAMLSEPSKPLDMASSDAGERDARIASASPDPEASTALGQPGHAAVEGGSGSAPPAVANEERVAPPIVSAVSIGAVAPSASPERVATDAPDVAQPPKPPGNGEVANVVGAPDRSMGMPSTVGTQNAAQARGEATSGKPTSITPVPSGGAAQMTAREPAGSPDTTSQNTTREMPQATFATAEPRTMTPVPSGGATQMATQEPVASPGTRSQSATRETPQPTSRRASSISPEEVRLSRQRGEALVSAGDIAAGRLLLQRAAQAHDAQAALVLAGTYDPSVLAKLAAPGVAADPVAARRWYETAKALGSDLASQRLDILAEWLTLDHASANPH